MAEKSDILVLGATGFTGRLITRYLAAHPQKDSFTLAIGARSKQKLQELVKELGLSSSIRLVNIDVTQVDQLDRAIKETRVVINTVGPYWRWGTPVVRACVRNGVHYVDLTGETVWVRRIILECDYYATKTGSIIVPSSGFDSIPSDISAYLSNKTLKAHSPVLEVATSTTAHKLRGGISGGTLSTAMTLLENVPKEERVEGQLEYVISPLKGVKPPAPKLIYRLPVPGAKMLIGGFYFMQPVNKRVVQRTFGLLELQAKEEAKKSLRLTNGVTPSQAQRLRYGPKFVYDEFIVLPSPTFAALFSTIVFIGMGLLAFVTPFRWLVKKFMTKPGDGPSEAQMQKGYLHTTNVTTSTSTPPVYVKTVLNCKGDPGYFLTAIMISESALCLVVPPVSTPTANGHYDALAALPPLARRGGVLTPMTAFGDVLIRRLEDSGRFKFSSEVVGN